MDTIVDTRPATTAVQCRGRAIGMIAAYPAMIAMALVCFRVIQQYGQALTAPPIATGWTSASGAAEPAAVGILSQLLVALTAVIVVGRLLGAGFRRIGQPPVMGEVIGGVILGPSLLGAVSPATQQFVLSPAVMPLLGMVAQLGVVLYMFLVGLELQTDRIRGHLHATVAISHASIVVPFVLGSALALYLYPLFSSRDVPFTSFALFVGIAMSITAFPVLARILSDFGLTRSRLGAIAITCAAVDDVTAWCLLALVIGLVRATAGTAAIVALLTVGFAGFMLGVVRPSVAVLTRKSSGEPTRGHVAAALLGLLVAALLSEVIGVHALFGAFLYGAVIPHESPLARTLARSLDYVVTILLLPAFFAYAGLRTEIGLLSGFESWLACALIIVVATVGKVGGTLIAGRGSGLTWRASAALGVLMNTRGLMQLIVLNVGLDLGVVTPTLFTMMVLMAVVTTLATAPALRWLTGARTTDLATMPDA